MLWKEQETFVNLLTTILIFFRKEDIKTKY